MESYSRIFVDAVSNARQAVVKIDVINNNKPQAAASHGSGIFFSSDGYLFTNAHVVNGGNRFVLTFSDGQQSHATLAGIDLHTDLAVLKTDATGNGFTILTPAEETDILIGLPVLAIGNPFGFQHTVTYGVISA